MKNSTFHVILASAKTGIAADTVQLVTDIVHPDYSKNLVIDIRVKKGTGKKWVKEMLGDD
jgi:hypothetical protein